MATPMTTTSSVVQQQPKKIFNNNRPTQETASKWQARNSISNNNDIIITSNMRRKARISPMSQRSTPLKRKAITTTICNISYSRTNSSEMQRWLASPQP